MVNRGSIVGIRPDGTVVRRGTGRHNAAAQRGARRRAPATPANAAGSARLVRRAAAAACLVLAVAWLWPSIAELPLSDSDRTMADPAPTSSAPGEHDDEAGSLAGVDAAGPVITGGVTGSTQDLAVNDTAGGVGDSETDVAQGRSSTASPGRDAPPHSPDNSSAQTDSAAPEPTPGYVSGQAEAIEEARECVSDPYEPSRYGLPGSGPEASTQFVPDPGAIDGSTNYGTVPEPD